MTPRNPFLHGSFAPVEEELSAFDLPVTGSVPAGLSGRYLRNGPNPLGLDDPGYRFTEGHWFLGPGMVHGVRLRDGRAEWYRNRWVRSRLLAESFGDKWAAGPVHDDMDFAANTHIICHAGRAARLALAVAERSRRHWQDGAAFVDLSSVTDSRSVPEAIASVLGFAGEGRERPLDPSDDAWPTVTCSSSIANSMVRSSASYWRFAALGLSARRTGNRQRSAVQCWNDVHVSGSSSRQSSRRTGRPGPAQP